MAKIGDRALRDQVSLEQLVALGERLQRDAGELLDRAVFHGEQVASATLEGELTFSDEAARSVFMTEYLAMLGPLLKKHGAQLEDGVPPGEVSRPRSSYYPDPPL